MNNNYYYNGVQHYHDPPILESYKKHLLMNKRENEKIIKFCFGGMESQGQLKCKVSLYEGIETEGPRGITVIDPPFQRTALQILFNLLVTHIQLPI